MMLYHGSHNKNLTILEPKRISYRDENEGPVVFATPDKQYAYCFIIDQKGYWPLINKWNDGNWTVVFRGLIDEIRQIDTGGAVYNMDSINFETHTNKPGGEAEWTSTKSTSVTKIDEFDSAIEVMVREDINVYFADEEIEKKIKELNDNGFSILKDLKPYKKENYS